MSGIVLYLSFCAWLTSLINPHFGKPLIHRAFGLYHTFQLRLFSAKLSIGNHVCIFTGKSTSSSGDDHLDTLQNPKMFSECLKDG